MLKFKLNKAVHKWLALLVGAQVLIWLATGLYFNLMDRNTSGGNQFRQGVVQQSDREFTGLFDIKQLNLAPAQSIKLLYILGQPYYQVTYQAETHAYQAKESQLFNALTGKPTAVDAALATRVAVASYKGEGQVMHSRLLSPPIPELPKEKNKVWQVSLTDTKQTNIYIDSYSGRVIAHVNNDKRLSDWMYKLHFMDYFNSGGFNHWLIVTFSVATLLLSITGFNSLITLFRAGSLSIKLSRQTQKVLVTLPQENTPNSICLAKNVSLLDALADKQITLPSICGGGGECGQCLFKTSSELAVTSAEQTHLSKKLLNKGYRLACQHKVAGLNQLSIERLKVVK